MAKQILTKLIDDIDGSPADETLNFAIDGRGYSIDLNTKHASKLRDFLGAYIDAGTPTGRVGSPPQLSRHSRSQAAAAAPVSITAQRAANQQIREWANQNGHEVSERGRIPQSVVEAFNNSKNASTVVETVKKASGASQVSFSK